MEETPSKLTPLEQEIAMLERLIAERAAIKENPPEGATLEGYLLANAAQMGSALTPLRRRKERLQAKLTKAQKAERSVIKTELNTVNAALKKAASALKNKTCWFRWLCKKLIRC